MELLEKIIAVMVLLFIVTVWIAVITAWIVFCWALLVAARPVIENWWVLWKILFYLGWVDFLLAPIPLFAVSSSKH